jgi:quercetin dioxygenase-like cupin family protein
MDGNQGGAQRFCVSHAADARFAGDGLRSFFEYRDLGIAAATGGRYHAQVIRAREAGAQGTGRHRHGLDFQMVYVLKGWAEFDYQGQGRVRIEAGDSVLQPPGIIHELMAFSDDMELLEITSPAEFSTEDA